MIQSRNLKTWSEVAIGYTHSLTNNNVLLYFEYVNGYRHPYITLT